VTIAGNFETVAQHDESEVKVFSSIDHVDGW